MKAKPVYLKSQESHENLMMADNKYPKSIRSVWSFVKRIKDNQRLSIILRLVMSYIHSL